ncbi:MAG TPA: hypothetical protein VJK52_03195, partial [Candidatus Nanoarchaeia archaeon]|nr:hypothetical protein [Candidatus Nanoarchaeia archaeon]
VGNAALTSQNILRRGGGTLEQITQHLFAGSRRNPAVESLNAQLRRSFQRIFSERLLQTGHVTDQVAERVLIGRALLDAIYEQIKETDLAAIAANIASQIPDLPAPLPMGISPTLLRDHYYESGYNRLTNNGLELLERLRKGGASPAKVIMAFSAALDPQHFDPQVAGIAPGILPIGDPDAPPRRRLSSDVLVAPPDGMNAAVQRQLQRIAKAVEDYEAVSDDKLEYREPENPAVGGAVMRDSGGLVAFQNRKEKYDRAHAFLGAVHNAAQDLETYFTTPVPPPGGGAPVLPTRPQIFTNFAVQIVDLEPPPAGPGETVPRASRVRDIVSRAIGSELMKSSDYKTRAESTSLGLVGTEACDAILGEYIRRTGRVDEETAKESLASLTGRVIAAREDVRVQRRESAEVRSVEDERMAWRNFNRLNRQAVGRNWLLQKINPLREYWRRLDMPRHFGLPAPALPMSEANPLSKITERYYALKKLTRLPETDEKHLPLTFVIADELTRLRSAIVERQVRNIGREMARKGINKLKKEDAERMGLRGANIDDLPYDQIQARLFQWLDGDAPENISSSIDAKIAAAWKPFANRNARREARPEWRKHPVQTAAKVVFLGKGSVLNPFTYPARTVKMIGNGIGKAYQRGKAIWTWGWTVPGSGHGH